MTILLTHCNNLKKRAVHVSYLSLWSSHEVKFELFLLLFNYEKYQTQRKDAMLRA